MPVMPTVTTSASQVPETTVRIARIPVALWTRIRLLAVARNLKVWEVVVDALERYVDQEEA